MLNIAINAAGVMLLVLSEQQGIGCDHNELWIFSALIVGLTGTIILVLIIGWLMVKAGLCHRVGRLISAADDETNQFYPGGAGGSDELFPVTAATGGLENVW